MDAAALGMLLPEGIVVNSSDIYKEVASYTVIPPEKIWQYWHAYTTTFRKLIDPKAHRLENFWWHVWGSDRRYLSGATIAKLYEDISTGPTFLDLHPPKRQEQPLSPRRSRDDSQEGSERNGEKSPRRQRNADSGKASSSSSKPALPPILKKSRGPSTIGPRPTARFVSPRDSEEEGEQGSQEVSSASTAATEPEMRQRSTIHQDGSDKKKAAPVMKKFVVSSSASKKRPVLPRQGSSQSSAASEVVKEGGSSRGPRFLGSRRSVHTAPEETRGSGTPRHQDCTSPGEAMTMSTKASGKQPAAPPSKKRQSLVNGGPNQNSSQSRPVVVQTTSTAPQFPTPVNDVNQTRNERQSPQTTFIGGYLAQRQAHYRPITRSMSSHDQHRPRELSIGQTPRLGLTSGATAGTTNVAAQGTLIGSADEVISPPTVSPMLLGQGLAAQEVGSMTSSRFIRGGVDLPSRPSSASLLGDIRDASPTAIPSIPSSPSLLDSRLATPTQRSSAPTVPLGRSKSQLTLLLERENARMPEKPRSKD